MTITTETDASLRHLAEYLMNGLNDRHQLAVASCWDFDNIPSDPSQYPALVIARLGSSGDSFERSRGFIKYMLLNQVERQGRPGLFRWVEVAIAELLKIYPYHDARVRITNMHTLSSQYRIGTTSAGIFPYIQIVIEFEDTDYSTL
jgi:hypothetical protein